jgi:hypothetical protein
MNWVGHVARIGEERKLSDRKLFVDLGVNGTKISEWMSKQKKMSFGFGFLR